MASTGVKNVHVQSIFHKLEKQRGKKKELHYIEKDGNRIENSEDILKEIQQFYKMMFSN